MKPIKPKDAYIPNNKIVNINVIKISIIKRPPLQFYLNFSPYCDTIYL